MGTSTVCVCVCVCVCLSDLIANFHTIFHDEMKKVYEDIMSSGGRHNCTEFARVAYDTFAIVYLSVYMPYHHVTLSYLRGLIMLHDYAEGIVVCRNCGYARRFMPMRGDVCQ